MSDCLSHQHSHPSTPATARLPNPFFNDQWLISLPAIPSATSNHTPEFANATRTVAAHRATLEVTKALAGLGVRVLWDDVYLCKVSGLLHYHTVVITWVAGVGADMGRKFYRL